MSARSFRSVFMVASCAGAALGCYMVSLRVASERAALEQVQTEIVMAERDIRLLQTEIGTRGRLAQLERWNARVLALSAPSADQFLEGGFTLARLARPQEQIDLQAPVVLASAPAPQRETAPFGEPVRDDGDADVRSPKASGLVHQASLKMPASDKPARAAPAVDEPAERPAPTPAKAKTSKAPALKTAQEMVRRAAPVDKRSTEKKSVPVANPVTKTARLAKADPLAPLPDSRKTKTAKDTGPAR